MPYRNENYRHGENRPVNSSVKMKFLLSFKRKIIQMQNFHAQSIIIIENVERFLCRNNLNDDNVGCNVLFLGWT